MSTPWFSAQSWTFRIESADRQIVEAFANLLVDMAAPDADLTDGHVFTITPTESDRSPAGSQMVTVHLDGVLLYPTLAIGSVASHVMIEINQRAANSLDRGFPLHAGAVASQASAIVLPGESGSGKTTLTTALALTGHGFIADELTVIDHDSLSAFPYGKPVALRPATVDLLRSSIGQLRRPGWTIEQDERFVAPRDLGQVCADPVPVACVVFPTFEATGATELTAISAPEALTMLMHSVLSATALTSPTFEALTRLVRDVPVKRLAYRSAFEAAEMLSKMDE